MFINVASIDYMMAAEQEYHVESEFNKKYSLVARRILGLLSNNSRMSISEIAKQLGVSRITVVKKIKSLQDEFDMHYTLELNEEALGLNNPHLILVKFKTKPDWIRIKEILEKWYIPQMAFRLKGSFDMLIYANAFSKSDYSYWDRSMRILLSEYGVEWFPSEIVHRQLGYYPIRTVVLDGVKISKKDREILKLLNENARMSQQELSDRLGIKFGTISYALKKLLKKSLIKRLTISIDHVKPLSFMVTLSRFTPKKGFSNIGAKSRLAYMDDDNDPLISRYILGSALIGSYDWFAIGVFDDFKTAYKYDVLYHKKVFESHDINLKYGEIEEVLLGKLPIRSIDVKTFSIPAWTLDRDRINKYYLPKID
jgi:DNA-binding Lrp family transcriptional regulator